MIRFPLGNLFYPLLKVVPVSLYRLIKEKKGRIRALWLKSKFRKCGDYVTHHMNVRWYKYKDVPLPPFKLLQYGDKGIFRESDAGL